MSTMCVLACAKLFFHTPQRVLATASGAESVAVLGEAALENGFHVRSRWPSRPGGLTKNPCRNVISRGVIPGLSPVSKCTFPRSPTTF